MADKRVRVFATCDIGDAAFQRLRELGYELEVYPGPEAPPKSLVLDQVRSGIDGLITTFRFQAMRDPRRLRGAGLPLPASYRSRKIQCVRLRQCNGLARQFWPL